MIGRPRRASSRRLCLLCRCPGPSRRRCRLVVESRRGRRQDPDDSPACAPAVTSARDPLPHLQIRNVVLVGCSGVGKTTLAESLALAAGAITKAGRVVDGTTVSDFEDIEHAQQRSVQLSVLPLDWNGVRINVLDPPGHPDFDAELRAGIRAADAGVFVAVSYTHLTLPTTERV